jgi:hypothetical protein
MFVVAETSATSDAMEFFSGPMRFLVQSIWGVTWAYMREGQSGVMEKVKDVLFIHAGEGIGCFALGEGQRRGCGRRR